MHYSVEIGGRLQAERKRLGLNQEQFGVAVGVSKRTQAAYEAGTTDPTSVYLNKAASKLGVDILYVVTGIATPQVAEGFTATENTLISQYRALPEDDQAAVNRIVGAMWEISTKGKE